MIKDYLFVIVIYTLSLLSFPVMGATVNINAVSNAEEPVTAGQFELTITEQQPGDVTVSYSIGGSAVAGVDYEELSGSAIISANTSAALIDVSVIDDEQVELSKSLTLTLTSADSGVDVNLFGGGTATISIYSNDMAAPGDRYAFLTSATGNAQLGSWPEAGGATGVDAADKICQKAAVEAGLYKGAPFAAWISTQTDDAFCRVNGLGGKRNENCGREEEPNLSGPWLRMDGKAMLPDIVTATDNWEAYYPVIFDENGSVVSEPTTYFHSTDLFGKGYLATCQNWTSASSEETTAVGSSTGTSSSWAGPHANKFCSDENRLLCLETGPDETPLPVREPRANQAFITSMRGKGQFDAWQPEAGDKKGSAAGDAICQSLAGQAGLAAPESFVAWVSTFGIDARDKITADGPWARVDGVVIADDLADLTDGDLKAPLNVDENGTYRLNSHKVWTGTLSNGTKSTNHCEAWLVRGGFEGDLAIPIESNTNWTETGESASCNSEYRLYCFSNASLHVIYKDGFEQL